MKYIGLLRGINVSGKNKIPMNELKQELENLGFENVITYLNSGNIIFNSDNQEPDNLIHEMIRTKFNLDIPVYIIEYQKLKEIVNHKPNWWDTKNKEIYDNLIFIIKPHTSKEIYEVLGQPKEELEQIEEYQNTIFWSFKLKYYQKTNWWSKTASTNIKDYITIRTANTINKLLDLGK